MYPNLNAELARKKMTLGQVVDELKQYDIVMSVSTLSLKKSGQYPFTLDEAKALKKVTGVTMTLEELFEVAT